MQFSPQPGPQTEFLKSPADIVIYGGAAGGGKTYALLLEPIRYVTKYKHIQAVIFRRKLTDSKKPGGLIDESKKIYRLAGGKLNQKDNVWNFARTESKISLCGFHVEDEKIRWQGSQIDILCFDELTHFTEDQFLYLYGRVRSTSGNIRPYCRATTNPEPESWVANFIAWWIKEDGFPDYSKSGVIRWFYNHESVTYWFDSKEKAFIHIDTNGFDRKKVIPSSFTFIPANINDNKILLKNNPNYYANLNQLPYAERMKLLEGNWKFRPTGKLFKAEWFQTFHLPIADRQGSIIVCDTASDIKSANDYTVFQLWTFKDGRIYLESQLRGKWEYSLQLQLLRSFILNNHPNYVCIEKAATGHSLLQDLPREVGVPLIAMTRNKDKYARAYESQPYIQSGYVYLNPKSDYYSSLISELLQFSPDNKTKNTVHDDQVDCLVDAIYQLLVKKICYKDIEKRYEYGPRAQNFNIESVV